MANVTLSIDDKLLQAARVRAVKDGTSVNEICRQAIEHYVASDSAAQRLKRFDALLARIRAAPPAEAPLPRPWKNRDEMYDQILDERLGATGVRSKRKGRR